MKHCDWALVPPSLIIEVSSDYDSLWTNKIIFIIFPLCSTVNFWVYIVWLRISCASYIIVMGANILLNWRRKVRENSKNIMEDFIFLFLHKLILYYLL